MLSDFPKLLQGSRGNSSPESHRPRPWQPALTTGPQGTAKDLVDQGGGLGLAIQPRDGSWDHTAPAPRATPTGQRCVLRIQTQPSHRIWGQNRSCAGVEVSGEGRQQPRAVSQRGRELGHPPQTLESAPPSMSPARGTRSPHSPLPRAQGTSRQGQLSPPEAPHTRCSRAGRPSAWHRW